jgi:AcrR family transcriptional regulator
MLFTMSTTRRERLRMETTAEILQTARRLLVAEGIDALALRAIAREMGMAAPALYRYYASREVLVDHLTAAIYDELADELRSTRDALDDPVEQLLAVARRFRTWSLAHPREFGLVFANPIPTTLDDEASRNAVDTAGLRFAAVFAESLATLWEHAPFAVPADGEIVPSLRRQLSEWRDRFPFKLPLGALQVFLTGWIRIYGTVCMEVFGHLEFALRDGEAMYEHEIGVLADVLRRGSKPETLYWR